MAFNNATGVYTPASGSETAAPGGTITSVAWNAINTDYATNMRATGDIQTTLTGVNLNSIADNQLTVPLPTGYSNYVIKYLFASNASALATTSTVALWTAASGAGTSVVVSVDVVLSPSTSATAQSFTIANQFTKTLTANPVYFRVVTAQGSPATCSVTLQYSPIS